MKPQQAPRIVSNSARDNHGVARDCVYLARVSAEMLRESGASVPITVGTLRALHSFLREEVRYVADIDPLDQRLRAPWATAWEGVGDCKSTAIFAAATVLAGGGSAVLRFTSMNPDRADWEHVYCIADGVPLDPLMGFAEHPPQARAVDVWLVPL